MIFRYDWSKIMKVGESYPSQCWLIFKMMVDNDLPYNQYDPIYKYAQKNFTGESFLLHPEVLRYNAYKYSFKDLTVYLAIASARSYAEYEMKGTIHLELIKSPVHPYLHLEDKSLLRIEGNLIHFPYEEVPPRNKQH